MRSVGLLEINEWAQPRGFQSLFQTNPPFNLISWWSESWKKNVTHFRAKMQLVPWGVQFEEDIVLMEKPMEAVQETLAGKVLDAGGSLYSAR